MVVYGHKTGTERFQESFVLCSIVNKKTWISTVLYIVQITVQYCKVLNLPNFPFTVWSYDTIKNYYNFKSTLPLREYSSKLYIFDYFDIIIHKYTYIMSRNHTVTASHQEFHVVYLQLLLQYTGTTKRRITVMRMHVLSHEH